MPFAYTPDLPLLSTTIRESPEAGLFLHRLSGDERTQYFKAVDAELASFDLTYMTITAIQAPLDALKRAEHLLLHLVCF
jgi:hypothetical protein